MYKQTDMTVFNKTLFTKQIAGHIWPESYNLQTFGLYSTVSDSDT